MSTIALLVVTAWAAPAPVEPSPERYRGDPFTNVSVFVVAMLALWLFARWANTPTRKNKDEEK